MAIRDIAGIRIHRSVARSRITTYIRDNTADTRSWNGIQYITGGEAVFDTGARRITAVKGDILCFGLHTIKERIPVGRKPLSFRLINFEIIDFLGKTIPLHETGLPFHIRPRRPETALRLLKALDGAFHARSGLRGLHSARLGLELLAFLFRAAKQAGVPKRAAPRPLHFRIREALDYINERYKQHHTLAALARTACMHPVYFAQLFKKEVGMPPGRYILELKIARAKDFLINHDKALAYTGEELGFHDYSHFYRIFRRITGVTPRQYIRRQMPLYDPR